MIIIFDQIILKKNMKNIKKIIFAILGVVLALSLKAQDYKHPYGLVNEEGKILSPEGKHIGWVTSDGIIKNSEGLKIAHIDTDGNLIDAKTGKKMGKAQKNGNYVPHYVKTPDQGWSVSPPMNGTCEVKNEKGEIVVIIHENYKQYGACAYHCLSMQKQDKDMKMK
jgi:hypothetical protein